MQVKDTVLKPLGSIELSKDEALMLKWLKSASWEPVKDAHEPIPYRAKVPEFHGGVRLFRMQAGGPSAGSFGALELFIKKLGIQGVITKPPLYPIEGHGNQPRYLALKKADLNNLGVGRNDDEDEE